MRFRTRFVLSLVLVFPAFVLAQVDRGSIVGMVTDPAGARIAGAQVTATNLSTNRSVQMATDETAITPPICSA